MRGEEAGAQRATGRDRLLVGTATLLLFAIHLALSSQVGAPTVVFDENGYLGTARWLAGGATWEMPFAPFYSAGYSVLLAPLLAVLDDPEQQWLAVRVVNAVLLAAVLPLLHLVLRRVLDVPPRRALPAAALGAIVPAVLAAGPSATAENLVLPLVPAAVLAAWATFDRGRRVGRRIWLGPVVGVLYFAHPRFTVAVPIVVVGMAVAAWRARVPRPIAATNGGLLLLFVGVATVINRAAERARWDEVEQLEGSASDWWSLVTSGSGLGELASTAIGQAWYLVIGSVGMALVGVAVLGRRVVGSGTGLGPDGQARRMVLGATLVVAAAVFATSVLFFAQNQFRADHYAYGRHNDSFTPLWVAAAAAYLLDRARRRRPVALLGAAAATAAALGAALSVLRDPADQLGIFSPFAVPAIIRYVGSSPDETFVRGTLIAVGAIAAAAAAFAVAERPRAPERLRPAVAPALIAVLACWYGWFGLGTVQGTNEFHDFLYDGWTADEVIERLGIEELCIDASAVRARANLSYPWHLPEVDARSYDAAAGEQPDCAVAIARLDDEARIAAGDRAAVLDQGGLYGAWDAPDGLAAWVRPGPEAARLDALGALLPEGFPGPLPESARAADLALVDPPPGPIRVAPGERVALEVRLRHDGSGAPWPDATSFGLPGHVRVVAQVTPEDPQGVDGARSGGELPAWMLPGDEATFTIEVIAVDQVLAPLPPGRYQVELVVAQVDQGWVTSGGEDSSFVLEVAG